MIDSASTSSILFTEERRRDILTRLHGVGKVSVDELARAYSVSLPTIRADLTQLEDRGLLRRTHGGAIPASPTLFEPPYAQREVMRHAEKKAIAALAVEMVKDGDTIILDAGTTVFELALLLRGRKSLTVVTNSLANVQALADSEGVKVVVIGGEVQMRRRATLGPLAVSFLDGFHVDRAFLSFNGVHPESGFTVVDFEAAEIKRRMMACAAESVVLCDSSKIGQIAFATVAPINAAATLITDSGITSDVRSRYADRGIRVISAT